MTPPRSLVFVHPSDEVYGADRMLLELVAAVPDGVRVEVWLPNDLAHPALPLCELLRARGIASRHLDLPIMRRAHRTPGGLALLARRAAGLVRTIRAAAPDVVYCTTSAAALAAPLARIARVPTVIAHVQEILAGSDRAVIGTALRACHRVLAISEPVRTALPPAAARRAVVVANATPDPGPYRPVRRHEGPLRFGVASRWNGWKGHATLLAAWDRLDDGVLTVLGGPPPSGEVTDVPALVARLRRPGSVEVVGELADPWTRLVDCDVVIMPSDRPEPFGLVAIEAFARGRPVVASAAGGLLEIVEDGRTGWLFPPGDVARLAEVLGALTADAVVAAGARARQRYEQRYTAERYAGQWRAAAGFAP
ncbi:MAG TPA: glycosyltransferase family 4 protein [Jatrophihabitans sp.]